jgi:hypothetical protein
MEMSPQCPWASGNVCDAGHSRTMLLDCTAIGAFLILLLTRLPAIGLLFLVSFLLLRSSDPIAASRIIIAKLFNSLLSDGISPVCVGVFEVVHQRPPFPAVGTVLVAQSKWKTS